MADADTILYSYDEFARALNKIQSQHRRGVKLKWTGPNAFHSNISGCNPEPSWHFSPEGMEYHKDHNRDFEAVCFLIAQNFGMHQGLATQERYIVQLQKQLETAQWANDFFRDKFVELRDKYEPLATAQQAMTPLERIQAAFTPETDK